MKKKQTLMVAITGAALLAAARAPAQISYSDGDLLLNFRETSDAGTDATIDLGSVNAFVSSVSALSGQTAVLDSGTGYSTSAYTPQFSGSALINDVGGSAGEGDGKSLYNVGFSAAAESLSASGAAADTIWLTRQISASQLATGGTPSAQQGAPAQNGTALAIQGIGFGAESASANPGIGAGKAFSGAVNGALVPDGNANSYHSLAQDPGNADLIDYGSYQNGTHPGTIEATPSVGTIYEALWEVPQSGKGSDVYEGYFTLQYNGQLSFTAAASAVPEPSTCALLVVTGALALAMRRHIRAA